MAIERNLVAEQEQCELNLQYENLVEILQHNLRAIPLMKRRQVRAAYYHFVRDKHLSRVCALLARDSNEFRQNEKQKMLKSLLTQTEIQLEIHSNPKLLKLLTTPKVRNVEDYVRWRPTV